MNDPLDVLMLVALFLPLALVAPAILATARPLRLEFHAQEPRPAMPLSAQPEAQPEALPGELAPAEEFQAAAPAPLAQAA